MPNINTLAAGAYWYVETGKAPVICEKRAGEAFIRFTNGGRQSWCREDDRFEGPLPPPAAAGGLPAVADAEFQDRTSTWAVACFGELIANDQKERAQRFVEEALELAQASGIPRKEVLQLVDYVFGRPVGQFEQEVGGVLTTLALLCAARQVRMAVCGETELARVWDKIEVIRAKQAAKPPGSPLPSAVPSPAAKGAPCELTPSQVNHLRRLLGWVRCEAGQEPEALVRTVKTVLPGLGEQPSAEAQKRLVVAHDAAMKVPRYVWAGIKALSRLTGEHLDLEDEEAAQSLSDEEVFRFWVAFKNDRGLMDEFDAFAGTARDIFDAKVTR
ncbi:hypothetical protein [Piscinibacter gummiphilus]|uniref:Uncharacterized protein n=1 Tax=Piscinibacter gummiphilus TaxID=946333 RepID=A0ABZ0D279_9BURK|nr:hypothetical protein [Piscinibacter gummiphilus]WOB11298.1 hypothetical protein RXV79_27080 [Piscinibacter gummiphilus]